jgi:tRNA threonylcarbamoyladenosine biosynthesis protein TsaE
VKKEFITTSAEETFSLGRSIGSLLRGGEILLLNGDLGAGKTLITKGIADGLQSGLSSLVASPSFTLVNIYNAKLDIIHVDLYRLDSDEIGQLGLEDYMDSAHVLVVEWAERAQGFFTGKVMEIAITYLGEYSRRIGISTEIPWITL